MKKNLEFCQDLRNAGLELSDALNLMKQAAQEKLWRAHGVAFHFQLETLRAWKAKDYGAYKDYSLLHRALELESSAQGAWAKALEKEIDNV